MIESSAFSADGAWCWFQDPRAVHIGGDHRRTFAQWVTRCGQLQVGAYDHASGAVEVQTLRPDWGADDHNVGAFLLLPDRRLMVFYARHNGDGIYSRTSLRPGAIGAWGPETRVCRQSRATYVHPVYLREEGRFYLFWRGETWHPTFATSRDGLHWSDAGVLLGEDITADRQVRPYLKVADDGRSRIHFVFTDDHPNAAPRNRVFHLRYANGRFQRADGTDIGGMASLPVRPTDCDLVHGRRKLLSWLRGGQTPRAWIWDAALDPDGHPVIAYVIFPSLSRHLYCYARWDGGKWFTRTLVDGGGWVPATARGAVESEPFYSGGMALDPADPRRLYLSRRIDGQFELERWTTADGGARWHSEPVTTGSDRPNFRPVVARGAAGDPPLLWMRGTYRGYRDVETAIHIAGGCRGRPGTGPVSPQDPPDS